MILNEDSYFLTQAAPNSPDLTIDHVMV